MSQSPMATTFLVLGILLAAPIFAVAQSSSDGLNETCIAYKKVYDQEIAKAQAEKRTPKPLPSPVCTESTPLGPVSGHCIVGSTICKGEVDAEGKPISPNAKFECPSGQQCFVQVNTGKPDEFCVLGGTCTPIVTTDSGGGGGTTSQLPQDPRAMELEKYLTTMEQPASLEDYRTASAAYDKLLSEMAGVQVGDTSPAAQEAKAEVLKDIFTPGAGEATTLQPPADAKPLGTGEVGGSAPGSGSTFPSNAEAFLNDEFGHPQKTCESWYCPITEPVKNATQWAADTTGKMADWAKGKIAEIRKEGLGFFNPVISPEAKESPYDPQETLRVGLDGQVNPVDFSKRAEEKFAEVDPNSWPPKTLEDFRKMGVTDPSDPKQLARALTNHARVESSLNAYASNPAECYEGILQFCGSGNDSTYGIYSKADAHNPDKSMDAFIEVAKQGKLSAYFGPIQQGGASIRANEAWYEANVAPYVQGGASTENIPLPRPAPGAPLATYDTVFAGDYSAPDWGKVAVASFDDRFAAATEQSPISRIEGGFSAIPLASNDATAVGLISPAGGSQTNQTPGVNDTVYAGDYDVPGQTVAGARGTTPPGVLTQEFWEKHPVFGREGLVNLYDPVANAYQGARDTIAGLLYGTEMGSAPGATEQSPIARIEGGFGAFPTPSSEVVEIPTQGGAQGLFGPTAIDTNEAWLAFNASDEESIQAQREQNVLEDIPVAAPTTPVESAALPPLDWTILTMTTKPLAVDFGPPEQLVSLDGQENSAGEQTKTATGGTQCASESCAGGEIGDQRMQPPTPEQEALKEQIADAEAKKAALQKPLSTAEANLAAEKRTVAQLKTLLNKGATVGQGINTVQSGLVRAQATINAAQQMAQNSELSAGDRKYLQQQTDALQQKINNINSSISSYLWASNMTIPQNYQSSFLTPANDVVAASQTIVNRMESINSGIGAQIASYNIAYNQSLAGVQPDNLGNEPVYTSASLPSEDISGSPNWRFYEESEGNDVIGVTPDSADPNWERLQVITGVSEETGVAERHIDFYEASYDYPYQPSVTESELFPGGGDRFAWDQITANDRIFVTPEPDFPADATDVPLPQPRPEIPVGPTSGITTNDPGAIEAPATPRPTQAEYVPLPPKPPAQPDLAGLPIQVPSVGTATNPYQLWGANMPSLAQRRELYNQLALEGYVPKVTRYTGTAQQNLNLIRALRTRQLEREADI